MTTRHWVPAESTGASPTVRGDAPIVLALTALLTIVSLMRPGAATAAAGLAALALSAIAWKRHAAAASSLGLRFVTCLVLGLAGLGPQQVVFALAFAVYAFVVSRVPWLRHDVRWMAVGIVDGRIMALGAVVVGVSGVALLVWHAIARPDLADLVQRFIPDWPLSLLGPAAIVFSIATQQGRRPRTGAFRSSRSSVRVGPVSLRLCCRRSHSRRCTFKPGSARRRRRWTHVRVRPGARHAAPPCRRVDGAFHHPRAHGSRDRHNRAHAGAHVSTGWG